MFERITDKFVQISQIFFVSTDTIRRVGDNISITDFRETVTKSILFNFDKIGKSGIFYIGIGIIHCFVGNIRANDWRRIINNLRLGFFNYFIENCPVIRFQFLKCKKVTIKSRGNIHGNHCALDKYCTRTAEWIIQRDILGPSAKINHACCKHLIER